MFCMKAIKVQIHTRFSLLLLLTTANFCSGKVNKYKYKTVSARDYPFAFDFNGHMHKHEYVCIYKYWLLILSTTTNFLYCQQSVETLFANFWWGNLKAIQAHEDWQIIVREKRIWGSKILEPVNKNMYFFLLWWKYENTSIELYFFQDVHSYRY